MKWLLATACFLGLGACAFTSTPATEAERVSFDGASYVITQLTAGTWTATTAGGRAQLPDTAASRAGLLAAIEKKSGCRVTDSDYSRQRQQLDAQVDCGDRLKN